LHLSLPIGELAYSVSFSIILGYSSIRRARSFIYQISVGFHDDENYPFKDFNILEHKEVWIKWLKAYMNDKDTEEWALKNDILPKQFYHILYQYNMIKENVHFISDEAKVDVQKIHDLEMPKEYFYELRDKIDSLS
jgi:hypothetical protein